MLLRLGHSPDSDDAFMFWALASGRVQSPGLEFEHILRDIETLNTWALEGRLECTAVSAHAYAHVASRYAILSHGASMGDGYGPKVVSCRLSEPSELEGALIAVPGEMTSAFLALRLWWSGDVVHHSGELKRSALRYQVMPFDSIMEAVRDGSADAGLIIHEGQLTYRHVGLKQIVDLGAWWKERSGLPLPLGVNVIRRDLPEEIQRQASAALRASIVAALENRQEALRYALQFARGLENRTADEFVSMYVNDWTVDMGEAGRRSIRMFLEEGAQRGLVPTPLELHFVD
ncbi:MAG: ABC transporter substrate-binding protein [Chthonomonadales bacterium]|nr:ABC transporter substrate-binding protein [Chthonomonadales bacterium]